MSQPLRSISITETSTLLRVGPPLCSALVLSRLWDLHLRFSLNIGTTASHVPYKSQNQGHAIFMPDAAQTVSRLPLDLSWNSASTPVLTPPLIFRHLINGRDRSAARAALGGELPTRTLSVERRDPNSTIAHVSASPPFHPGRSDFPSPVGDHGISPYSLPYAAEA